MCQSCLIFFLALSFLEDGMKGGGGKEMSLHLGQKVSYCQMMSFSIPVTAQVR